MPRRNATTALLVIDMFSRFDFPEDRKSVV